MKLANDNIRPSGGYRYRVSETGHVFVGTTMHELRVFLGKHCKVHNLPMPTQQMIEEQICFELGKNAVHWCMEEKTGMAPHIPVNAPDCAGLSLNSVKQASFTLLHSLVSGTKVDQVEADRRASICVGCTQNREVPGCKGCAFSALKNLIDKARMGRTTSYDDRLNTCCVCGCLNRVKIWMPMESILHHTPIPQVERLQEKAPNCWILDGIK